MQPIRFFFMKKTHTSSSEQDEKIALFLTGFIKNPRANTLGFLIVKYNVFTFVIFLISKPNVK